MPEGDLITEDWQVEIRGLLLGAGTRFQIQDLERIEGQTVKTADVDLYGDGAYAGTDRRAAREIVLKVVLEADDTDGLDLMLDQFALAWNIGGDVELHWQLAGMHKYVTGRTRDWIVNARQRHAGIAEIAAEFFAGDPTVVVAAS